MKPKDIAKWVALAAAVYFGYKWAVENGHIQDYLGLFGNGGALVTGNGQSSGAITDGSNSTVTSEDIAAAAQEEPPKQPSETINDYNARVLQRAQTNARTSESTHTPSRSRSSNRGAGSNTAPGGSGGGGGNVQAQVVASANAAGQPGPKNFWEWNFFLPANLTKPDPFATNANDWPGGSRPTNPDEVRAVKLTADQWWNIAKTPLGLGYVNHWQNSASRRTGSGGDWLN